MVPTIEDCSADLRSKGCEEIVIRDWRAGEVLETHVHPFAAKALVVRGEMWLTQRGQTHHLTAGDSFELEAAEPHAERYGAQGPTYWVGRPAG